MAAKIVKDSKLSLATKKKTVVKLRNVLAEPFTPYWPEITGKECDILGNLLKEDCKTDLLPKSSQKFGLNSCLRAIKQQKADLGGILFSTEIKPKFIISQIINFIFHKYGVDYPPVLCVPNLKAITKEIFGVSSLSVIISTCRDESVLNTRKSAAIKWIRKKSTSFPVPKQYFTVHNNEKNKQKVTECREKSLKKEDICEKDDSIDFSKIYLRKSSKDARAFIPKNVKYLESRKESVDQQQNIDFIAFSNDNDSSSEMDVDIQSETFNTSQKISHKENKLKIRKSNIGYIPLCVNKIQGNPDKKKKKKKKKKNVSAK